MKKMIYAAKLNAETKRTGAPIKCGVFEFYDISSGKAFKVVKESLSRERLVLRTSGIFDNYEITEQTGINGVIFRNRRALGI